MSTKLERLKYQYKDGSTIGISLQSHQNTDIVYYVLFHEDPQVL